MTPAPQETASIAAAPACDFMSLARQHYENFPVGSWLLPRDARAHLHRIYAFARTADDLADELRDAAALAEFRRIFLAHVEHRATATEREPLFVDLVGSTIEPRDLPLELFTDLLDAFEQDLHVTRYPDADALYAYCAKSANPVGRLVLRVCGYRDLELDLLSDRICTALQLVNHLQDLRADLLERDRIYLPLDDLRRHGASETALRTQPASPAVRALVREWTDRCARLLCDGWPLTQAVRGRLRLELRAICGGAAAVIAAIRAADHDVLTRPLRISRARKLCILARAVSSSRRPREFA